MTAIEPGAAGTVLYPSGVAAIVGAVLAVVKPGDVLLVTDNAYEPSRLLASGLLKRLGVAVRFFDPLDVDGFAGQFCERTTGVLLESPGSLTMEVCDVPALAAIARGKGAAVMLDNTWATPLGFPALEHGCDIAIQALTKHVGGHSDLMMGACTAGAEWYAKSAHPVAATRPGGLARRCCTRPARPQDHGNAAASAKPKVHSRSPNGCAAATRSQKCCARCCPGAPGHDLWQRDFTGGCGLFSFVLGQRPTMRRGAGSSTRSSCSGSATAGAGSRAWPFLSIPSPIRTATRWPRDRSCRPPLDRPGRTRAI